MDSDYGDDFETSVAEEPAHKRMVLDPAQTKKGLDKGSYPTSCRTMPDAEDEPMKPQVTHNISGAGGKKVQSMQNVANDSSEYEQEFENEEDEEDKKHVTPTKVQHRLSNNLSTKKQSNIKEKSPLVQQDKSKTTELTQKKLELENTKLRTQIKLLKEQLLRQGVNTKDQKQSNRKNDPKTQANYDKIRNIERELSNMHKVFTQTEEEHQRIKQKLDKIKEPQYVFDLEKEIEDTLRLTEDMKKENKKLALAAKNSGKALEKKELVVDSSDPAKVLDLKTKENLTLAAKLEKLQEKNANFSENHDAKMAKLSQLQEGYQQLLENKKGVIDAEDDSEKITRYNQLKKKADLEEMRLKDARKKFYLKAQFEKELEELVLKNSQFHEELKAFTDMIFDQLATIRSLSGGVVTGIEELSKTEVQRDSYKKPVKDLSAKSTILTKTEPASMAELENIPTSARNIKPPIYKKARRGSNEFDPAHTSAKAGETSKHRILVGKLKARRGEGNLNAGNTTESQEVSNRTEIRDGTTTEILSALRSKDTLEQKDKLVENKDQAESLGNINQELAMPLLEKKDELKLNQVSQQKEENITKEKLPEEPKIPKQNVELKNPKLVEGQEIKESPNQQSVEAKLDAEPVKTNEISFSDRNRLNRARRGTNSSLQKENQDIKPVEVIKNEVDEGKKDQKMVKNDTEVNLAESLEEISLKNTITGLLHNQKENLQLEQKPANRPRDRAHLFENEVKQVNKVEQKQEDQIQAPLNIGGGFGKGRDLNIPKQNDLNQDLALKKASLINEQENFRAKENLEGEKISRVGRMKQRESFDKKEKDLAVKAQAGSNGFFDEFEM